MPMTKVTPPALSISLVSRAMHRGVSFSLRKSDRYGRKYHRVPGTWRRRRGRQSQVPLSEPGKSDDSAPPEGSEGTRRSIGTPQILDVVMQNVQVPADNRTIIDPEHVLRSYPQKRSKTWWWLPILLLATYLTIQFPR